MDRVVRQSDWIGLMDCREFININVSVDIRTGLKTCDYNRLKSRTSDKLAERRDRREIPPLRSPACTDRTQEKAGLLRNDTLREGHYRWKE